MLYFIRYVQKRKTNLCNTTLIGKFNKMRKRERESFPLYCSLTQLLKAIYKISYFLNTGSKMVKGCQIESEGGSLQYLYALECMCVCI